MSRLPTYLVNNIVNCYTNACSLMCVAIELLFCGAIMKLDVRSLILDIKSCEQENTMCRYDMHDNNSLSRREAGRAHSL